MRISSVKRFGTKAVVKQIDHGLKRIQNTIESLNKDKSYAKAGIMGKSAVQARPAEKKGEGGAPTKPLTNVQLALTHEFGVPSRGIPERSFIRASFAKNRKEYETLLFGLVRNSVYAGRMSYTKALSLIALKMSADMKNFVTQGPQIPPPNSPATLARKIKKGYWKWKNRKPSNKPVKHGPDAPPRTLVDTGRMVGSITWAVVRLSSEESRGGGPGKAIGKGAK